MNFYASRSEIEELCNLCPIPWTAVSKDTVGERLDHFAPKNEDDWDWARSLAAKLDDPFLGERLTERFLLEEGNNSSALLAKMARLLTQPIQGTEIRKALEAVEKSTELTPKHKLALAEAYTVVQINYEGVNEDKIRAMHYFDAAIRASPADMDIKRRRISALNIMQEKTRAYFSVWRCILQSGIAEYERALLIYTATQIKANLPARFGLRRALKSLKPGDHATIAPLAAAAFALHNKSALRRILSGIQVDTITDKGYLPWILDQIKDGSLVPVFWQSAVARQAYLDPGEERWRASASPGRSIFSVS